jgi:hypothetical protein
MSATGSMKLAWLKNHPIAFLDHFASEAHAVRRAARK